MTRPPPAGTAAKDAAAAGVAPGAKTIPKLSSQVRILNSVSNGSGWIRRRDAEFFLARGRAVYVGRFADCDHIRLLETNLQNQAAARRAARDDEKSFEENRNGVIFWNGGTGSDNTHIPGKAVS